VIVAEWSSNVPKGKFEEFLSFVEGETKPLWKAHSAVCNVYRCIDKRYFSYQTSDNETRIVEQIRFKTIEDFEKFYNAYKTGAKDFQVLKAYESRLKATNTMLRIYKEL